jgi:hypothetical protein
VINQRGEYKRLVGWVTRADTFVQKLYENWKFMRVEYSESTLLDSPNLPTVANLLRYDEDTFKIIEEGSTDPNLIEVVEYEDIKSEIRDTTSGIPDRVIFMPDGTLQVEPPANGAHTINCDYYQTPVKMVANDDVSIIPARYHDIILGRALILYANYENAPEIKGQGTEIYIEQLARLENNQLPNKFGSRYRTGGFFEVVAS